MKRIYESYIKEFLHKKMVLLTGPRQCGKTTISKTLVSDFTYLNYDAEEDRQVLKEKSWSRKSDLIIFDELHKKKKWKQWLKGIFDTEGASPPILVTGSAKLDTYKKVGDSLAGRYFQYRLHPFDIREISKVSKVKNLDALLDQFLNYGGFPEPFLENQIRFYNLWKKTHLDIILKEDLINQEDVRDLRSIGLLVDLLKRRVGSPISYSNLANELEVSDKTIKRWLILLENMYVIFKLSPYSNNIARSNRKRPKYYFYDTGQVVSEDGGAKFENLVACSLLKEVQFRQDCLGEDWELWYLSKKGGIEIDFAITKDNKLTHAIEVKLSDTIPSKSFNSFSELVSIPKIQLLKNIKREKEYPNGIEIRNAANWLCEW